MKNEKGSITLFVLISMLFFLIIATTAYVSASRKLQGQNEELALIKASYEQDLSDAALLQLYNRVTKTRDWMPGNGTQEDTYKIYTIEDLVAFSNRTNTGEDFTNKYVELMNDLDFKRDSSYANANRTDFGDINEDGTVEDLKTELTTGSGWHAIGNGSDFSGVFLGNEKQIKNLYVNSTKSNQGLFGVSTGTIKDITVRGEVKSTGSRIAGIVGYNSRYGKVINCNSYVNVDGGSRSGGIAGQAWNSEINNCSNFGIINGGNSTGGIVGYLNSGSISNGRNYMDINGREECVGGICGHFYNGKIELSLNIADVRNTGAATGGIVGYSNVDANGTIINCYNAGLIIGSDSAGGIFGQGTISIYNCYNNKEVSGNSNVHSIAGIAGSGNIVETNCYYLSTLSATDSGATALPAETMTSSDKTAFVDLLNAGQTDLPWQLDTSNINGGYPILKWQTE